MKEIIINTLESVKNRLKVQKGCFEIFGYDFIIDDDLQVFLIEVNTNPCMELSNAYLTTLIPRMVNDAFKLTIDIQFPPRKRYDAKILNIYDVEGIDINLNIWTFVYQFQL